MSPSFHYDWDLSLDDARRVQHTLAAEVDTCDNIGRIRTVAGLDLGYPRTASGAVTGRAAVVVLSMPDFETVEEHVVTRGVTFPHVPGLLSFREAPVALAALERVQRRPDLLIVDGPGRAHRQRFGVASHLGVLLDVPTIGCARSTAIGLAAEPAAKPGSWTPLRDGDAIIGAALRTRAGSKPIYVSAGHRISLETAVATVMRCSRGYRLPEAVRLADQLANRRERGGSAAP